MSERVLVLNVKREYFEAIQAGTKDYEYRLRTAYWDRRISGRVFDWIEIRLGYPRSTDKARILRFPWHGYKKKKIHHPHFGEKPVDVYAIRITHPERITKKTLGELRGMSASERGAAVCDPSRYGDSAVFCLADLPDKSGEFSERVWIAQSELSSLQAECMIIDELLPRSDCFRLNNTMVGHNIGERANDFAQQRITMVKRTAPGIIGASLWIEDVHHEGGHRACGGCPLLPLSQLGEVVRITYHWAFLQKSRI